MKTAFLSLLNMSISAGWIVLAVVLLRLLLRKGPKWLHCLLWAVVGLRLLLPVFPESTFSFLPSARVIPTDIVTSAAPAIHTGIAAVNGAVNPKLVTVSGGQIGAVLSDLAAVWLVGVAAMLVYSTASCLHLRRQVRASLRTQDGIYLCDDVDTPFILGFFRPRIYMPSGLSEEQQRYVAAHENAHLKRHDHWWKPIGFVLLSVHWFNPLLWLGYILLCRDIEMACDEKVIRDMDNTAKRGYSEALLSCSLHRRRILACPLAFGEVAVKTRIKGVLNYKKPVFWMVVTTVILCVLLSGSFLTNPPPCSHSYEGKVILAATCTAEGSETFTCTECWDSYKQPIPMHAHSYGQSRMTKEPDCSHTGEMSADCGECGQTHVVEVLQTNGVHHMENTQLRAPTCTDPGEGANTCTDCGFRESCTYELAAHDFKNGVTSSGNCTFPQQTQQICRSCGLYEWAVTGPKVADQHFMGFTPTGAFECAYCGMTGASSLSSIFNEATGYSSNPNITDATSVIGKSPSPPQLPGVQWDETPGSPPDFSWLYP